MRCRQPRSRLTKGCWSRALILVMARFAVRKRLWREGDVEGNIAFRRMKINAVML